MFKENLEELTKEALEISGQKSEYTDEELADATVILMEVLANKMYDYLNPKISYDELVKKGEEMGSEFRQFFIKYTGVDMHKIYKK